MGFNLIWPGRLTWTDIPATISYVVLACFVLAWIVVLLQPRAPGVRELLVFVASPIFAALAISYIIRPVWHDRSLAYLAPFCCIILALAWVWLLDRLKAIDTHTLRRIAPYGFLLVFGFASLVMINRIHERVFRPDYRGAAYFVMQAATPGDVIYLPDNALILSRWSWYSAGPGSVNLMNPPRSLVTDEGIRITTRVDQEDIRTDRTYWVVSLKPHPLTRGVFSDREPESIRDFHGVRIAKFPP
jgi:hypothetical protein